MEGQEDEDQLNSDQQTEMRSKIRLQIFPWHISKVEGQGDEDNQIDEW